MKKSADPSALNALRLIRSEGVGPSTYMRLTNLFGSVEKTLEMMGSMKKPLTPADTKKTQAEYDALLKIGGEWLVKETAAYPAPLAPFDDAPPVLAALGNTELLKKPMLAIVGARNASIGGRKLAAQIARDLGQAGFVIVSGMARGIDAAAHEAALETGTVAVMANGVDVIYPPENKKLYDAIKTNGVILSENVMGCEPAANFLPRRNRIVSGLSKAVILIEAAAKSGSLITTRFVLDQGRDVFAIPGSPLDPRASGGNHLIKTGQAQLIESAQDVLNALGILNLMERETMQHALQAVDEAPSDELSSDHMPRMTNDQSRHIILSCLGQAPCTIDQITYTTQLPVSNVLTVLMELELSGRIQRLPGDRVVLAA